MASYMSIHRTSETLPLAIPDRFAFHRIVPISDCTSHELPWHEALMRPNFEIPTDIGEFIEELYASYPSRWVDLRVFRSVMEWQKSRSTPGRVSINVHPESLLDGGFVDEVTNLAERNARRGHEVCLELVEYGLCTNKLELISNAQRLRKAGVLIALDDFGRRLNCFDLCGAGIVDLIKIDMGVTKEVTTNPNQRAVMKSIVGLAVGLGAKAIAEGVETRCQLDVMRELGVHYAQGYLLGKPSFEVSE